MDELEERAFRDMLITDREFWHFNMLEDDYEVELWNPLLTFYHKSPSVHYVSQGNWVGKLDMMSISDVVDKYGWMMTQEQLEALEAIYPVRSAALPLHGLQNDGSYYDATRPHAWNVEGQLGQARLGSYQNMANQLAARGFGSGSGLMARGGADIERAYGQAYGNMLKGLTKFANTPTSALPAMAYNQPQLSGKGAATNWFTGYLDQARGYNDMLRLIQRMQGQGKTQVTSNTPSVFGQPYGNEEYYGAGYPY